MFGSILFRPPPAPPPPVTNYMLLYSTLLCKKIARAPGGHKKFMLTKFSKQSRSKLFVNPGVTKKNVVVFVQVCHKQHLRLCLAETLHHRHHRQHHQLLELPVGHPPRQCPSRMGMELVPPPLCKHRPQPLHSNNFLPLNNTNSSSCNKLLPLLN